MKNFSKTIIIALLTTAALSGCASRSSVEHTETIVGEHNQKMHMMRASCGGQELTFYQEASMAYFIICKDGRQFIINK